MGQWMMQTEARAAERWFSDLSRMSSGLARRMKNPVLRPLVELHLNGSTTVFGTWTLKDHGLAETAPHVLSDTRFRGTHVSTLELTSRGSTMVCQIMEKGRGSTSMQLLVEGILEYACRDSGHSICLTRAHLETALANEDGDLLELFRNADNFGRAFPVGACGSAPEAARLASAGIGSPEAPRRTSAKIHQIFWELGEPLWSEKLDGTSTTCSTKCWTSSAPVHPDAHDHASLSTESEDTTMNLMDFARILPPDVR